MSIFNKLKIFILTSVLIIFTAPVKAQLDSTTLIVVGTVHSARVNFNEKILLGILQKIKPDVILVELDSSFFDSSANIKQEFINISLENKVVANYKQSTHVPLHPYDIEGRNQFYEKYNYFTLQQNVSKALKNAKQANQLNESSQLILDAITRFDDIAHAFSGAKPELFNSDPCDVSMRQKEYYDFDGMLQIVQHTPSLSPYIDFCKLKHDFWIKRNDTMVEKIIKWSKIYQGRKVVVLCGFEHRYYLLDSLRKKMSEGVYEIMEPEFL
jgi:hypothetical protein